MVDRRARQSLTRGVLLSRSFLICFLCLTLWGCKPKPEPGPILIGHVAPFSGPDKRLGEHAQQAIVLAVEKANQEANRIAGRRVEPLSRAGLSG